MVPPGSRRPSGDRHVRSRFPDTGRHRRTPGGDGHRRHARRRCPVRPAGSRADDRNRRSARGDQRSATQRDRTRHRDARPARDLGRPWDRHRATTRRVPQPAARRGSATARGTLATSRSRSTSSRWPPGPAATARSSSRRAPSIPPAPPMSGCAIRSATSARSRSAGTRSATSAPPAVRRPGRSQRLRPRGPTIGSRRFGSSGRRPRIERSSIASRTSSTPRSQAHRARGWPRSRRVASRPQGPASCGSMPRRAVSSSVGAVRFEA